MGSFVRRIGAQMGTGRTVRRSVPRIGGLPVMRITEAVHHGLIEREALTAAEVAVAAAAVVAAALPSRVVWQSSVLFW